VRIDALPAPPPKGKKVYIKSTAGWLRAHHF
jgi:hypothetical protein